ncbi:hypothetical protein F8388_004725 [Cannabis sativa]|uniref:DUF4283 domain-containing protein n=1 Tax=Cannabis sativa TaxID=3483 RepID=A0A7J6HNB4_CANSA|nr:hypothetical protein F8388_004725 [Cannabis sativa]
MEFVCHSELVVGKNLSLFVATISLIPCDSTIKSLNSLCLFGKVTGPLIVDESCLKAFTKKEWGRHVFVSLVPGVAKKSNLFELIFKEAKDRELVLDNDPWIVKGSHLLLKTWSPLSKILNSFMVARLWVQIHNLSFEFFSIVNGNDMGALVGSVVKVYLDENKPATWSKWLRILIDVWIESPLFLGSYIKNDNGTKIWIQFNPDSITSTDGSRFPLFDPWLNVRSTYTNCFASKPLSPVVSEAPGNATVVDKSQEMPFSSPPRHLNVNRNNIGEASNKMIRRAQFLRRPKKTTPRPRPSNGKGKRANWIPQNPNRMPEFLFSSSSIHVVGVLTVNEKGGTNTSFPILNHLKKNDPRALNEEFKKKRNCNSLLANEGVFECGPATETFLMELKQFGEIDSFEIKAIDGHIGVQTTSNVNAKTTLFKKENLTNELVL